MKITIGNNSFTIDMISCHVSPFCGVAHLAFVMFREDIAGNGHVSPSCDHLHCDDQWCHYQPSLRFVELSLPKEQAIWGFGSQTFCYWIAFVLWPVHNFKFSTFSPGLQLHTKHICDLNLSSRNKVVFFQSCKHHNYTSLVYKYPLLLHCSSWF